MQNNDITTIIFDLGGVLVDWDPKYMYRTIFETEEAMDHFLKVVCTFDWNEMQDGGRTIAEANQVLIEKFPEYTTEILAFYGRWKEMLVGAVGGTVEILKKIKEDKKYRIFALTNWSAETWPIAIETFDFLSWFEDVLVSGQEKLKKPDPKIYQLTLSKFGLSANECLFIDDNKRNVLAARNENIRSIHFTSSAQLKEELTKLNIL